MKALGKRRCRDRPRGLFLCSVVAGAFLTVTPLGAQERPGQAEVPAGRAQELEASERTATELERRFMDAVARALDLTADQRRTLAETLAHSRAERVELRQRRSALRRELDRLVAQSHPDDAEVSRLLNEQATLQEQQLQISRDEQKQLRTFLSPVQQARLQYMRQRMAQALLRAREAADVGRPTAGPRHPSATRGGAIERARRQPGPD